MTLKDPKSLRSYRWYGPDDLRSFGHRSRAASMGCVQADYAGKPVIAGLDASAIAVIRRAISEAFRSGFRLVLLSCAGLSVASALVAWRWIAAVTEVRTD
jgi:hypothetical protein